MSDSKYKNNMMLFKSFGGEKETFRMMPITEDCPYAEVIYNPAVATLVVISKIKKQNFQFLPKLDGNGDILTLTNLELMVNHTKKNVLLLNCFKSIT